MSPASYLTAPPRVAAQSVAPPGSEDTVVTMAGMALLAWISLDFLVVALVGSVTVAVLRGLRAWRLVRAFPDASSLARGDVSLTAAVATSAVGDAENGEAFLGGVERSYVFATRLLSGDEEAALTLRGVGPLESGTVVLDVGGGSTELITESFRLSMDIGSVRLTERFGFHQGAAAAYIRAQLPELRAARA